MADLSFNDVKVQIKMVLDLVEINYLFEQLVVIESYVRVINSIFKLMRCWN